MGEVNGSDIAVEIAKITQRLTNTDQRIKALEETTKRIESLTISVEKLAMSVEIMAKDQVDYRSKQNDLAKRLLEVEQAPAKDKAKRWEDITKQIISILVGGLIGYVITQIGL